jgi:hypothetical protein
MVQNEREMATSKVSHTVALKQPHEGIVKDATGRVEEYAEERTMEAGTSFQPPQWNGRKLVARSP